MTALGGRVKVYKEEISGKLAMALYIDGTLESMSHDEKIISSPPAWWVCRSLKRRLNALQKTMKMASSKYHSAALQADLRQKAFEEIKEKRKAEVSSKSSQNQ